MFKRMVIPALALAIAIAIPLNAASAEEPQAATSQASKKKPKGAPALVAGQFASEADAKASCPGDVVVWVNLGTKVYHHAGASQYGATKRGAYMCEKNTAAAGFRAAKNEKNK
jgi:hypothetical protein